MAACNPVVIIKPQESSRPLTQLIIHIHYVSGDADGCNTAKHLNGSVLLRIASITILAITLALRQS